VTWQVNGATGGNSSVGTISSAGLYTTPTFAPNPAKVTVTAVLQSDPSHVARATVRYPGAANESTQAHPIELGTTGGNANNFVTSGNTITCCSGTLGSLVTRGANLYILSNNHVLARSQQAAAGEPISQPGLVDTTTCTALPSNTVANLSEWATLPTNGTSKNPAVGTV